MAFEEDDEHVVKALDRLPEQYRGKERLSAMIAVLGNHTQIMESVLADVQSGRAMDSAVGAQLDGLGQIVGLERVAGQSDEDYRELLYIQVIQNNNRGTPEEIIAAAKFFIGTTELTYYELYPAAVSIFAPNTLTTDEQEVAGAKIRALMPAGVKLAEFGHYDADAFLFDEEPGLGDTDDINVGGLLADLYP
jgi:hypothetical protein